MSDKPTETLPKTDGANGVVSTALFGVSELCAREGIELRGDDGQPYCCGERMRVKGGIIGPDYAECLKCGKTIGNMASPHINGGYILRDELLKSDKTWTRLDAPNGRGETRRDETKD